MDENNNEEYDNIVTLKDEDGNDVKFEYLDLIEYQGEEYVILLPTEEVEDSEPEEVVILQIEKAAQNPDDEETYISVQDENILNAVFEIFKDKFKDEFNFVD